MSEPLQADKLFQVIGEFTFKAWMLEKSVTVLNQQNQALQAQNQALQEQIVKDQHGKTTTKEEDTETQGNTKTNAS